MGTHAREHLQKCVIDKIATCPASRASNAVKPSRGRREERRKPDESDNDEMPRTGTCDGIEPRAGRSCRGGIF